MKSIEELYDMKQAYSADFMVGFLLSEYEHLAEKLAAKEEICENLLDKLSVKEDQINTLSKKIELPKRIEQPARLNPVPKEYKAVVKELEEKKKKKGKKPSISLEAFYAQLKQMLLVHKSLTKKNIQTFLKMNKIEMSETTFNKKLYDLIHAGKIVSSGKKGRADPSEYSLPLSEGNGKIVMGTNYGAMNLNA